MSLTDLNPQQQEAVLYNDGPLLIVAGAGSGKTRVITHKIAHLIEKQIYQPEQILAVTFTKKAANEMKERVQHLLPNVSLQRMTIGTFHSLGALILRRNGDKIGLDRSFSIYDDGDQQSLVKKILADLDVSDRLIKPGAVMHQIGEAKMNAVPPKEYLSGTQGDVFDELVAKVYTEYDKRLKSLNAVDFDDLLLLPLQLWKQYPDILDFYRNRFGYVLVDEYQDTNHAQYEIIKLLTEKHRKLCAVGDEDQSIYSWRGATIENIRNFKKDYPEAKIIKLEQNYRSTPVILEAANQVISKNPYRTEKNLWTDSKSDQLIVQYEAEDQDQEAYFIVQQLERLRQTEFEGTVAVLYRTNVLSRTLEDYFVKYNIPHKIVGGVGFYERMEIKDVLSYMRFVNNARDEVSLLRIINTPSRKIGASTIDKLRKTAQGLQMNLAEFFWFGGLALVEAAQNELDTLLPAERQTALRTALATEKEQIQNIINIFGQIIWASFNATMSNLLDIVLKKTGYTSWLQTTVEHPDELANRLDNIAELFNLTAAYAEPGRDSLAAFLEDVSLVTAEQEVQANDKQDNAITVQMMTIHAAKGLEFDVVFLVGLEEGLFPHSRSYVDLAQLEEERRLCYVALTRAKQLLYLTYARRRTVYGNTDARVPSRYLEDIPEHLRELL